MKGTVLILGATSAIARSAAHAWAEKGYSLYLAARNGFELERLAADIKVRFQVDVRQGLFDAEAMDTHAKFFDTVVQSVGELAGVLVAFGDLGETKGAMNDFHLAKEIIDRNFTGACSILTYCANYFAKQGKGFMIGISSVAGDRGRQSNYIYGAAKGGFSLFLQGMRNRLSPAGVRVITIKPGFVDTAMTFGKPGMFLVASPEKVGKVIAASPAKFADIVYVPWFWRPLMFVINLIPEFVFKRLKL